MTKASVGTAWAKNWTTTICCGWAHAEFGLTDGTTLLDIRHMSMFRWPKLFEISIRFVSISESWLKNQSQSYSSDPNWWISHVFWGGDVYNLGKDDSNIQTPHNIQNLVSVGWILVLVKICFACVLRIKSTHYVVDFHFRPRQEPPTSFLTPLYFKGKRRWGECYGTVKSMGSGSRRQGLGTGPNFIFSKAGASIHLLPDFEAIPRFGFRPLSIEPWGAGDSPRHTWHYEGR